jgi:hypothetical protein
LVCLGFGRWIAQTRKSPSQARKRFGLVWFGLVWFGLVWFGLVKLKSHSSFMGVDMLSTSGSGTRFALVCLFLLAVFLFSFVWFPLVWFEAQRQASPSWGTTLGYTDFHSMMGFTSKNMQNNIKNFKLNPNPL